MISGLFYINAKGEILVERYYRDDITKQSVEAFKHEVISAKNTDTPVILLDNCSFMYIRQGDLFFVAMTKLNSNPAIVFNYMYRLNEVFQAYMGSEIDENLIRENFTLIYELLDETMDNGWPQVTAVNLLKELVHSGKLKNAKSGSHSAAAMTAQITGAVDWRTPGQFKYRKNEVYIDALESVNLLMSSKGTVLRADVSGKVIMKSFLTGMPECKFGMNDKLVMEKEAQKAVRRRPGAGIAIDDVTFHRCVRLGQFDTDRTISFIPPDGEFELMRYRITQNVNLPFKVIPVVSEFRSRVEYEIKIKGNFSHKLFGNNVVVKIPTPNNTAKCKLTTKMGRAKYVPEQHQIVWKIRKFPGDASFTLKGEARLLASMEDKTWSRPPITMDFHVHMFTASGLHVRFLKVFERTNYQTVKWVRYITKAGSYQIRI